MRVPGLGQALALAVALTGCGVFPAATPTPPPACPTAAPTASEAPSVISDAGNALVKTNKGTFTIELNADAAPIAVANFVLLARCHFYDGISFHRVIPGFVIQAGDPQTKSNRGVFEGLGSGGPGYQFVIEPVADDLAYDPYVVAMAHSAQPNSNGSQFFINLADLDGQLPREYTIFGRVVSGTEVIDVIGALPTTGPSADPRVPGDVPLDPAIIQTIEIQAAGAAPTAS